jgi:Pyruvate/2-oxoacid:ferredoxin oxidoreductase delta subunit
MSDDRNNPILGVLTQQVVKDASLETNMEEYSGQTSDEPEYSEKNVDLISDSPAAHMQNNEAMERTGATSATVLVRSHHQGNAQQLPGCSLCMHYCPSKVVSILYIWKINQCISEIVEGIR